MYSKLAKRLKQPKGRPRMLFLHMVNESSQEETAGNTMETKEKILKVFNTIDKDFPRYERQNTIHALRDKRVKIILPAGILAPSATFSLRDAQQIDATELKCVNGGIESGQGITFLPASTQHLIQGDQIDQSS